MEKKLSVAQMRAMAKAAYIAEHGNETEDYTKVANAGTTHTVPNNNYKNKEYIEEDYYKPKNFNYIKKINKEIIKSHFN